MLRIVPAEFLSDEQAAAYGRFTAEPSRDELERFFFLDDADRALAHKPAVTITGSVSRCSWGRSAAWARSYLIR
jgi:hypothetical protein